MKCAYHVHTEMVAEKERVPRFVSTTEGDSRPYRTVLRCPVVVDRETGRLCAWRHVLLSDFEMGNWRCKRCGCKLTQQDRGGEGVWMMTTRCKKCRQISERRSRHARLAKEGHAREKLETVRA
jgi:hypothetical protein